MHLSSKNSSKRCRICNNKSSSRSILAVLRLSLLISWICIAFICKVSTRKLKRFSRSALELGSPFYFTPATATIGRIGLRKYLVSSSGQTFTNKYGPYYIGCRATFHLALYFQKVNQMRCSAVNIEHDNYSFLYIQRRSDAFLLNKQEHQKWHIAGFLFPINFLFTQKYFQG